MPKGRFLHKDKWLSEGKGEHVAELAEYIQAWVELEDFDLEYRRWLSGHSGAYVVVMRRYPHNGDLGPEDIVLKAALQLTSFQVSSLSKAKASIPDRFRKHLLIWKDSPKPLPGGPWRAYQQSLALTDSGTMTPLAELQDHPDFPRVCSTVLTTMMQHWNGGTSFNHEEPACHFIQQFLAERVDRTAAIREFAKANGLNEEEEFITLRGRTTPLPNPLALLQGRHPSWQKPFKILKGNTHGDLHLGNILVPVTGESEKRIKDDEFLLIDLEHFDDQGPRAHDPMRLLLAAAAAWLPSLTPHLALRSALAETVVRPKRVLRSVPLQGYLDFSLLIHKAAGSWLSSIEPLDVENQTLLVLLGRALRSMARDDTCEADRWWYLEVAALAMDTLFPSPSTSLNWATSPTEACATDRAPLPPREQATSHDSGRETSPSNVLPFRRPAREAGIIKALNDLIAAVEGIPSQTTPSGLGPRSVPLIRRARELQSDLESVQMASSVRRVLGELLELLALAREQQADTRTLGDIQKAVRRLRSRVDERWTGRVG
ncbi:hypothetical protein AB0O34_27175 [Sphaerisporangium sp. NPDC088356]|uniref:hypothetical protein n=1 Tax=Sphaerisporangium sp. NPDC088356 TaxID=3154871 RepID=UPI003422F8D8